MFGSHSPPSGSGTCWRRRRRSWAQRWPSRRWGRWLPSDVPRCRWWTRSPASSATGTSAASVCSTRSARVWTAPASSGTRVRPRRRWRWCRRGCCASPSASRPSLLYSAARFQWGKRSRWSSAAPSRAGLDLNDEDRSDRTARETGKDYI